MVNTEPAEKIKYVVRGGPFDGLTGEQDHVGSWCRYIDGSDVCARYVWKGWTSGFMSTAIYVFDQYDVIPRPREGVIANTLRKLAKAILRYTR